MYPQAIRERIETAREIATSAGDILLTHFGRLPGYDQKTLKDFVSIADLQSEAYIMGELRRLFPLDAFCGEESDGFEGARRRRAAIEAAEFAWCIDPLDGTTNFVHGYPVFAVSIGLLSGGRPVAGVVHAPTRRETYLGGHGIPAVVLQASAKPERLRVSGNSTLARSLLTTGFTPERHLPGLCDALLAIFKRALLAAQDVRRSGSAALDLCDIAAGRLEGYFEAGLAPWDVAAGQAILEAAGGRMSRYDGTPLDLFGRETVATNGLIHAELVSILQDASGVALPSHAAVHQEVYHSY